MCQLKDLNGQKIVFCYQNCSDLLQQKKCYSDWEQLLKFEAECREFEIFLRSLEQIYSNSERSKPFLVTECFFNLFLQIGKIYWDLETFRKSLKMVLNFQGHLISLGMCTLQT